MSRRVQIAGLALAALLVAACSSLPDKPVREVQYDFGPVPAAQAPAAAGVAITNPGTATFIADAFASASVGAAVANAFIDGIQQPLDSRQTRLLQRYRYLPRRELPEAYRH